MFFNLRWKNCEKSFVGGRDHFEKGVAGDKNQYEHFARNEILNIFHLTIFSRKTIFSKITKKNNFREEWPFLQGMGRWMTKMNTTFSAGNRVPTTAFKFFPQKTPYRLDVRQKSSFWGHIFICVSASIGTIVSKKK